MTTANQTLGAEALITALQVLNQIADEFTTYEGMREQLHLDGLAAKLLMIDQLRDGEAVTLPDARRIDLVEEQLEQLFTAAHILGRVYTSTGG